MPAGRKKLPTQFHILNGTDRPCRRNDEEPIPESDFNIPKPPKHLSKSAKKEWGRMSKILHSNGLLTKLDYSEFEIYCQAYGRWVDAEELMKKTPTYIKLADGTKIGTGMIMMTKNGNAIQSPLLNIATSAMRDCDKYLSEFGMTPSSRTKIKVGNAQKKQNKFTVNTQQQVNS